jgi:hypothetical protein
LLIIAHACTSHDHWSRFFRFYTTLDGRSTLASAPFSRCATISDIQQRIMPSRCANCFFQWTQITISCRVYRHLSLHVQKSLPHRRPKSARRLPWNLVSSSTDSSQLKKQCCGVAGLTTSTAPPFFLTASIHQSCILAVLVSDIAPRGSM